MDAASILKILQRGEDSRHQFKLDFHSPTGLASELAAFSNAAGGMLLIGVSDNQNIVGVSHERIKALNQMISNVSSQGIHPPINPLTEIIEAEGKNILVLFSGRGLAETLYGQRRHCLGQKWRRQTPGNCQRRAPTHFQASNLVHADETPVKGANMDQVDLLPTMSIKAVCYPGTDVHADAYVDSEDITGKLELQYRNAMSFISRNLHHVQNGQSVNSTGGLAMASAEH